MAGGSRTLSVLGVPDLTPGLAWPLSWGAIHSPVAFVGEGDVQGMNATTRVNGRSVRGAAVPTRRPAWLRRHVALLVVLDALAAGVAVGAARVISFGLHGRAELPIRSITIPYNLLAVVTVPTWVAVLAAVGCYDIGPFGAPSREASKVVRAGAWYLALMAMAYFVVHLQQLGRDFLATIVPVAVAASIAARLALRVVLRQRRRRGSALRRAVLVGSRSRVTDLVRHLGEHPFGGIDPVGACMPGDASPLLFSEHAIPVVGDSGAVLRAVDELGADSVVIAGNLPPGEVRSLTWSLEGRGVDVLVVPTLAEEELLLEARPVAGLPLLYVDVAPPQASEG